MFELLKESYELAPEYKEAQILYALSAMYTKNGPLAKELLTKIGQDTIVSDNRFLQTYAAIGDYNSAITILKIRLQKDPNNVQYKLSLASAYMTIGQKQMAIDLINQIIKDNPSFKDQGEVYIKQIQNS
jgi:predicted Zn-dependent protease